MATRLINLCKANSLATQIRDAERQVLSRQRRVDIHTDTLLRTIHRQVTAPTTLLLVSGAGFMMGELTKRQPSKLDGSAYKTEDAGISPMQVAINLVTSIQTLYTALPIVWMIKTFVQPDSSGRTPEQ